jgi:hypothetical protein
MIKHSLFAVVFFVVLSCATAAAQNLCPAGVASDKLICVIPQAFGPNGLQLQGSFQNSFVGSSLKPLTSAIARQAVLLPLASPSSGITFIWDPVAKVPVPSPGSFGPILSDRAETIGKYKLFVSFDYQYLKFGSLDGVDLNGLPEVFTQPNDSVNAPPGQTCSALPNGSNTGLCAFIRDVVKVNSRVDLKIHEFTTFVTFGVTNRIDVSIAMPIRNVRLGIFSNASIVDISTTGRLSFPSRTGCGEGGTNCLNQPFSNSRTASGVADMTLRVKGTAWKGERAAVALGAEIRLPTGDALNFLGSGTAGFKPFVVWSLSGRISPHALVGYEVNGSSVIAGDVSTGTRERLPSQFTYSGGADIQVTKWFTAAFDLLGQQVFEAQRLVRTNFTELAACTPTADPFSPTCPFGAGNVGNVDPNLSQLAGTFNITSISVGGKLRPFSNLLLTGNALLKVNSGGLRSSVIPLLGISYTF